MQIYSLFNSVILWRLLLQPTNNALIKSTSVLTFAFIAIYLSNFMQMEKAWNEQ